MTLKTLVHINGSIRYSKSYFVEDPGEYEERRRK
jgi:hypothetical protein